MLTNPITGKIIRGATNNKFLLEVVNNWFPTKYIPTTKVLVTYPPPYPSFKNTKNIKMENMKN